MPDQKTHAVTPSGRRHFLTGALSLLAIASVRSLQVDGLVAALSLSAPLIEDDYVLVDGWVLPGKYFRS